MDGTRNEQSKGAPFLVFVPEGDLVYDSTLARQSRELQSLRHPLPRNPPPSKRSSKRPPTHGMIRRPQSLNADVSKFQSEPIGQSPATSYSMVIPEYPPSPRHCLERRKEHPPTRINKSGRGPRNPQRRQWRPKSAGSSSTCKQHVCSVAQLHLAFRSLFLKPRPSNLDIHVFEAPELLHLSKGKGKRTAAMPPYIIAL